MQISSKLWGEFKGNPPFSKGQHLADTALPSITITLSQKKKKKPERKQMAVSTWWLILEHDSWVSGSFLQSCRSEQCTQETVVAVRKSIPQISYCRLHDWTPGSFCILWGCLLDSRLLGWQACAMHLTYHEANALVGDLSLLPYFSVSSEIIRGSVSQVSWPSHIVYSVAPSLFHDYTWHETHYGAFAIEYVSNFWSLTFKIPKQIARLLASIWELETQSLWPHT